MLSQEEMQVFRADLLRWYSAHKRDLPWRQARDPYSVWISETMLQQTRVAAVIPFYERFLKQFPDLHSLANANESTLLASWAGLGYYHRARNLQKAARLIEDAKKFPASYDEIRKLPGVGNYTAAAIASISFDLPYAVLDGNVFRVLSRVLADGTNIASVAGRKHFAKQAEILLDPRQPGTYNQAVMELGATVCLPSNPQCLVCPVTHLCKARTAGEQDRLPVKVINKKSADEKRTVFWIVRDGRVLLWQRTADSRLMPGFWELPERAHLPNVEPVREIGSFRHGITFHKYQFSVVEAEIPNDIGPCHWTEIANLAGLPLSTVVRKARSVVDAVQQTHR